VDVEQPNRFGCQYERICKHCGDVTPPSDAAPVAENIKREVLRFVRNEVEIDAFQLEALADIIDGVSAHPRPDNEDAPESVAAFMPNVARLREALEAMREVDSCQDKPASIYCDHCFDNMTYAFFACLALAHPEDAPGGPGSEV
jgi:hypothetical protein